MTPKERKRQYYIDHREERLAYQKKRYARKSEELRAYQKAYVKSFDVQRHAREIARKKAYRLANVDQINAKARDRYPVRAETLRARKRAWAKANWKKLKEAKRLHALKNPHMVREKASRRRALKRRTQRERVDYRQILKDSKGLCGICNRPLDLFGIDFDHIVPLSRGGTHTRENIQASHSYCNRSKWAKVG